MSSANWTTDFLNQLNNATYHYSLNKSACPSDINRLWQIESNHWQQFAELAYSKMCVG